jgi:protein phosphatase
MRMLGATESHVGNVREANQDRAYADSQIAAVADGMGGHQGGERAAELAIGKFHAHLPSLTEAGLVDLMRSANLEVHGHAANNDLPGMGTTLVALALHEDGSITVANVGDSRAYWIRDGFMRQITEDHSFVEDLVRQGRLSPEEAAVHPQRNILTRAVGIGAEIEVDQFPIQDPEVGDRFLLCSDGLFNELTEDEILSIVSDAADPEPAARALIDAALQTPCRDNVTVAVVELVADDDPRLADLVDERLVGQDGVITDEYVEQSTGSGAAGNGSDAAPTALSGGGVAVLEEAAEQRPPLDADAVAEPSGTASPPDTLVDVEVPTALDTAPEEFEAADPEIVGDPTATPRPEESPVTPEPRNRLVLGVASVLLAVGFVAVLGAVSFFLVRGYAQSGFFIAEDAATGELTVFQGRRGGFLGFEPSAVPTPASPDKTQLTPEERRILDEETFDSAEDAHGVLNRIDERIAAVETTSESSASDDGAATGQSGLGSDDVDEVDEESLTGASGGTAEADGDTSSVATRLAFTDEADEPTDSEG